MCIAGLHLLSRLQRITSNQDGDQLLRLIVCLAAFTDQRDPWSSPAASEQAVLNLDRILEVGERDGQPNIQATLTDLLQLHVKPVFVKFKTPTITKQGRRAIDPALRTVVPHESEEETQPWKFSKAYTVSIYGWVLGQLDVNFMSKPISGLRADDFTGDVIKRKLASRDPTSTCFD